MKHILLSNQVCWAILAILGLILGIILANMWGLRINLTSSLPQGFYREVSGTPVRNDLVSFCLQGQYAQLAFDRGYVGPGSCTNGLRPLLKRLAKLPGDYIDADTLVIHSVDSQGRLISSALQSGTIPPNMALVLADHPGSFDSRYFGFVPLDSLKRIEPVFLFHSKGG